MSSPNFSPRRTPKQTPGRTPLQERTASERNENQNKRRLQKELTDSEIFNSNPFPTKPQHVLLPSTIRQRRGNQPVANELPDLLSRVQPGSSNTACRPSTGYESLDDAKSTRAPEVQLKRSVTALRDMYEAQAEKSRPSTAAASPALRPWTASSRLRSASSSEGLGEHHAWDLLSKVSSDDLATLPPLTQATIHKINSKSSFASRVRNNPATSSSPNYRIYDTSSPRIPVYRDSPDFDFESFEPSSSSGMRNTSPSSPNFVRLGRSSSMDVTDPTPQSLDMIEEMSSPNFVKLGSSSVRRMSSPVPSEFSTSSTSSRKRKRSEDNSAPYAGRTPIFMGRVGRFRGTPPTNTLQDGSGTWMPSSEIQELPSSPLQPIGTQPRLAGSSGPVVRLPRPTQPSSDAQSVTGAHSILQTALSSSPVPPVQYPVVKAPPTGQFAGISIPKRKRGSHPTTFYMPPQNRKLSPVPSEWSTSPGPSSRLQSDDVRELDDTDSIRGGPDILADDDLNSSSDHIVLEADLHEASDEITALPGQARSLRPGLVSRLSASSSSGQSQPRLNSLRSSMDTRLNSMKSFTHSRQNSLRSIVPRPGSAGSLANGLGVPTWARRYYSGIYLDSFQALSASSSNLNLSGIPSYAARPPTALSEQFSTSPSTRSHATLRGVRDAILNFVPSVIVLKKNHRLDVRRSHTTAGIGPLVSHPVGADDSPTSHVHPSTTIRRVSQPLSPVDPRAHWNGVIDSELMAEEAPGAGDNDHYAPAVPARSRLRMARIPSPHLHQDHRLNTGSSASAGFGHPFNRKSRWQPPRSPDGENHWPSWFHVDLRSVQVVCFIAGFAVPLSWFVAALLPLPHRPSNFKDVEKAEWDTRIDPTNNRLSASQWEQMDVIGKLRLERHVQGLEEIRWQNARWWRRMNRWMCVVGVVVIVIVIALAVMGTQGKW